MKLDGPVTMKNDVKVNGRRIMVIIWCTLMGVIPVISLSLLSADVKKKDNGFVRSFALKSAVMERVIDLEYNSYYIAGWDKTTVYLANRTSPLHLLALDAYSADKRHVTLSIADFANYSLKSFETKISPPYFYLVDGILPVIFKGDINTWKGQRIAYDSAYFTKCVPLGPASFAIRTVSSSSHNNALGKEQQIIPHIQLFDNLLEKQVDGIFCTDGMLHYSKERNEVIYLYHYRNQYLKLDTNLTLMDRGRTIDTTSRAVINVDSLRSNSSLTISSLQHLVNHSSCVSGNYLFVSSKLIAANEDPNIFKDSSVIDIYDLGLNTYVSSFYLEDFNNQAMKDFTVEGQNLIALYDHYAIIYKLDEQQFKLP